MATESPLLSKVTVDFQQTVDELFARFDESIPWQNKLKSNMGTVLVDMIAGTFSNNQYYIESSAREAYLRTALRDSSVYAICRGLGVKIVRRTPASVTTQFFNPTIQEMFIEAGETFSLEGRTFFNKSAFGLKAGESVDIVLYEGVFKTQTFNVADLDSEFPEIQLNEPGFIVADKDIRVEVVSAEGNAEEWALHEDSIFELGATDKAFMDSTTADGDVLIIFGDNRFGQRPDITSTVRVTYVLTNGVQGNAGLPGQVVKLPGNDQLRGTTTENVSGGTGIKDIVYYKKYAPYMYASKKRMVSPPDWYSNIALYPGVGDVSIMSQRDIAPNDPTWMNVVRVCILPESASTWGGVNPTPTSAKWTEFLAWAATKTRSTIQPYNPIRIPVEVNIEVLVDSSQDLKAVKAAVEARIRALFRHVPGTLGKRLAVDDIADAIRNDGDVRVKGIDYSRILSPIEDILPQSKLEYVGLKSLNVLVKYSEREQF